MKIRFILFYIKWYFYSIKYKIKEGVCLIIRKGVNKVAKKIDGGQCTKAGMLRPNSAYSVYVARIEL